ncbi:MAG TPA: sugar transferase [Rhizobiaceae bacterium]
MKRAFDLALSVPLALVACPLIAAAAIWIKLTSPGPVLFAQPRVGRHEKPFLCLKLRTMYKGTVSLPTHEVGGQAVTKAGRVLRRLKLDELPQLWNVIKGEMSLVGPRPCLPTQKELIEHRRAHGVYELRPGITGLAQVEGIDMSDPKRCAEKDAEYLRSRSVAADVRIMVRTLFGPRPR